MGKRFSVNDFCFILSKILKRMKDIERWDTAVVNNKIRFGGVDGVMVHSLEEMKEHYLSSGITEFLTTSEEIIKYFAFPEPF